MKKLWIRRAALLLAAILILTLGVKLIRGRKTAAEAETPAAEELITAPDARITALKYDNGSATLSFALQEEHWVWADLPDFPLDESRVTDILELVTALRPQQTLSTPEDPETYGLDDPAMHLVASLDDGTDVEVDLGNKVTGDSGSYYLRLNENDHIIYIVSGELAEALSRPIYGMAVLPELPSIGDREFRRITVSGEREYPLTCTAYATEGMPSSWRAEGANVTDSPRLKALVEELGSLQLDSCLDYAPSERAAEICGFVETAPTAEIVWQADGSEQTLTLTVGGLTLDTAGRCVRINGEAPIYTVAADALTTLLSVAADGLEG